MSARDQALAHLVRRTLEEHLYFVVLWERWVSDEGFANSARDYFPYLPWPLRCRSCHARANGWGAS